jgi:hypothetical protein
VAKGQKLVFRWRVVIHPESDTARLSELYKDFTSKR